MFSPLHGIWHTVCFFLVYCRYWHIRFKNVSPHIKTKDVRGGGSRYGIGSSCVCGQYRNKASYIFSADWRRAGSDNQHCCDWTVFMNIRCIFCKFGKIQIFLDIVSDFQYKLT